MRLLIGGIGLASLFFTLPVTLSQASDGSVGDECLTLADRPQVGAASIGRLEACRAVAPDDAVLLADLGTAYEAAGRADDAERVYRQVLELDAGWAEIHLKLARHLLARGRLTEARDHAGAGAALLPNNPSAGEIVAQVEQALARAPR